MLATRLIARLTVLAALLALAMLAAVGAGAVPIAPGEVLGALAGGADATVRAIVVDLRLPRAVLAALIGAALA
ncbi:MAG: iron chelate uptake ABC transporter family permease subunit, partial [Gemmatimonadota bacterium]